MFEFSGILTAHIVWKLPKNVSFEFFNSSILAISINFCPIKIDLSGNIVWEQVKGLKNSPNWPFLALSNELSSTQLALLAMLNETF